MIFVYSFISRRLFRMKCFNLEFLENFNENVFANYGETIFLYKDIIHHVNQLIDEFQQNCVANNIGIALDTQEHWNLESCILLLAILNHNCHFYCVDLGCSKDLKQRLETSGVQYLIMQKKHFNNDFHSVGTHLEFKILKIVFYLIKLKVVKVFPKDASNFCYTIATSGSTGEPKMIHVPYECIEPNISALSKLLKMQQNDVILLGSPPSFDPFVVEFFLTLANGASIAMMPSKERLIPNNLLAKLLTTGVTIMQTTPSLLRIFTADEIRNILLNTKSSLRCLLLGGEEFPSALEMQKWLPEDFTNGNKRIFNIYGVTEISCWASIQEYKYNDQMEKVPMGAPLDSSIHLKIICDDSDDNLLMVNNMEVEGELLIGSAKRCCYIPQIDKTETVKKECDILFRNTGDLVKRDKCGNIYFVGRKNNVIKRFGKRLCLDGLTRRLETILLKNNMPHCNIICLWDDEISNLIFCVVNKDAQLPGNQQFQRIFAQNLEAYEQPDKIHFIDKLILNRNGKVDRKLILKHIKSVNLNLTPKAIFLEFLHKVIGLEEQEEKNKDEVPNTNAISAKRSKTAFDLSFLQAGGTSFQALALSTEISESLKECEKQRQLLEMLLNDKVTLKDIINFLCNLPAEIIDDYQLIERSSVQNFTKSFKILWKASLNKCIDAQPSLFRNKYVSIGSHSHLVVTFDCDTGQEMSKLELPDRIECTITFVFNSQAVVGCYDGFLYAFDFENGSILWRLNIGGMIKAKPMLIRETLIVASYAEEFNVRAFNIKTLKSLWNLKLGTKGIFSSPILMPDKIDILICTLDGTYALVNAESGNVKWLQNLQSPIFSTPNILHKSEEIALAEVKGLIHICTWQSGKKVTSFQTNGNIFSSLTLHQKDASSDHTYIIFGCHDSYVYCLSYYSQRKQLEIFWKLNLNAPVYSTPILITNNMVFACSAKGYMILIDLQTSEINAMLNMQAEIFSTPCKLSDRLIIYIGSRDNYLYALKIN